MGSGNIQLLVFATYIIEVIIQICLIARFGKNNDIKDWVKFLGSIIAVFIFDIIAFYSFTTNSVGFESVLLTLFICGFILCFNFILLMVGLIIKNSNKYLGDVNVQRTSKILFFKSVLITLICNLIILFIIPALIQRVVLGYGETHIINYLQQKYGNGNYEVVNVVKSYAGTFNESLSSYRYEIKSDYIKDTFIIEIEDEFRYIMCDYFLPVYYSEKYKLSTERGFEEFEEYIQNNTEVEKFSIRDIFMNYARFNNGVEYNQNYFIVPENYGKIPSINEFINLIIKYYNK